MEGFRAPHPLRRAVPALTFPYALKTAIGGICLPLLREPWRAADCLC